MNPFQYFYWIQVNNIKRVFPRSTEAYWVHPPQFYYWNQGNHLKRFGRSDSASIFLKVMNVLNELQFWTFLWVNFDVSITLSLFDIFKLFYSLMLICEIMIVQLLFLDFWKTFLPCLIQYKICGYFKVFAKKPQI